MVDQYGNLPEGLKWSSKEVKVWEWRCPYGDLCGKNQKLLYKKDTRDECLILGSQHLFDKGQHSDPSFTWQEAVAESANGVTENMKDLVIVIDENGDEQDAPKKTCWRDNKQKGDGWSKPKWRDDADKERPQKRSRSRSRRPPNSGSSSDSDAIMQKARPGEVLISKIELDHLVDCIDRTVAICDSCAQWAKNCADTHEDSSHSLKDCNHTFDRFKRT